MNIQSTFKIKYLSTMFPSACTRLYNIHKSIPFKYFK